MLLYNSGKISKFYNKQNTLKRVERTKDFCFSDNTTYNLGGKVDIAYFPKNIIEACAVYDKIFAESRRYAIIGNGSDILASDNFFDGAIICTKRMKGIYKFGKNTIFCLSGTSVGMVISYCLKNNLSGLEYLYGIPATVGGLAFMNGGAGGKYIADNIKAVKLYNGKIYNLSAKSCHFSYKHSTMRDINSLILGVFLSVLPSNSQTLQGNLNYYKSRRAHLPTGKSCGCVFKNCGNLSAGKLIEDAHLKGARIGGAHVSESHANFIINDNGSAEDVKKLIDYVRKVVEKKCGILLEEEVVYIGDFDEFNR